MKVYLFIYLFIISIITSCSDDEVECISCIPNLERLQYLENLEGLVIQDQFSPNLLVLRIENFPSSFSNIGNLDIQCLPDSLKTKGKTLSISGYLLKVPDEATVFAQPFCFTEFQSLTSNTK